MYRIFDWNVELSPTSVASSSIMIRVSNILLIVLIGIIEI